MATIDQNFEALTLSHLLWLMCAPHSSLRHINLKYQAFEQNNGTYITPSHLTNSSVQPTSPRLYCLSTAVASTLLSSTQSIRHQSTSYTSPHVLRAAFRKLSLRPAYLTCPADNALILTCTSSSSSPRTISEKPSSTTLPVAYRSSIRQLLVSHRSPWALIRAVHSLQHLFSRA